jgi:hypothetical protein
MSGSTATAASAPLRQPGDTLADSGLLLIHGIGSHPRTTTMSLMANPLLERLAREQQLIETQPESIESHTDGGSFDALRVTYRPNGQTPEEDTRELLIVEGRWNDSFERSDKTTVSAWVGQHSGQLMWFSTRYFARGILFLWSLVCLAFLGAAVYFAYDPHHAFIAPLAVGAMFIVALAVVLSGDVPVSEPQVRKMGLLTVLAAASTFIAYQIQRGLVTIASGLGVVLVPLLVIIIRWLSALPLPRALKINFVSGFEESFMSGGIADMEVVVENHVDCAAIHARLRDALVAIESRVREGGRIVVVGNSGGAILAWWLLSEPDIQRRQAAAKHSYCLITVGAPFNWAKRGGFTSSATPLDAPLVNHDSEMKTIWLNAAGTWDRGACGGAPSGEFAGWKTWPDGNGNEQPNRLMRNRGSPMADEHAEYFANQQEFVPLLARAIDEEMPWAFLQTTTQQNHLSNIRLAIIAPLVRTRLMLLAVPVAAIARWINPEIVSCSGNQHPLWNAGWLRTSGAWVEARMNSLGMEGTATGICHNDWIFNAMIVLISTVVALALFSAYNTILWPILGHHSSLTQIGRRRPLRSLWLAIVGVWGFTFVAPLALYPFAAGPGYGLPAGYVALIAFNFFLCALEVWWLRSSLAGPRTNVTLGRCRPDESNLPAASRRGAETPEPAAAESNA